MPQDKLPPGQEKKGVEVHPGRIGRGVQGKKDSHGKAIGHQEHGTVTFYDADQAIPDEAVQG